MLLNERALLLCTAYITPNAGYTPLEIVAQITFLNSHVAYKYQCDKSFGFFSTILSKEG